MKRMIFLIGVCMMLISFSGCSMILNNTENNRTNMLESDSLSEAQMVEKYETIIVNALKTKDRELLKSVFSQKALSLVSNIEEGTDYIFDIYQGDFVEISDRNHSSEEHFDSGKQSKCIDSSCVITTSTGKYELFFLFWGIQDFEPSAVGIYSLALVPYEESVEIYGYRIAGIDTPEYVTAYKMATSIKESINNGDVALLQSLFQDELTGNAYDLNAKLQQMLTENSPLKYLGNNDSWITINDKMCDVYIYKKSQTTDILLYFRMNLDTNKITRLKITKIDKNKKLNEYKVDESNGEFDIFLD